METVRLGRISVRVRGRREFRVRLWIAIMLIRLASCVVGMSFEEDHD